MSSTCEVFGLPLDVKVVTSAAKAVSLPPSYGTPEGMPLQDTLEVSS